MLLAATAGFWLFNLPPAKIFMGDTGALFLGFALGFFGMIGGRKSPMATTLLVPIVLLFVPIIDTIMAIIRRTINRTNPFAADKRHLHHRLLHMGIKYHRILIIIYLFCFYLGGLALLSTVLSLQAQVIVFIFAACGGAIGLYVLNLFEKHYHRRKNKN
jgi:UDP-GlcNAc:undecaprenyl-phosphate GlcNAc-1-phosphate transferase